MGGSFVHCLGSCEPLLELSSSTTFWDCRRRHRVDRWTGANNSDSIDSSQDREEGWMKAPIEGMNPPDQFKEQLLPGAITSAANLLVRKHRYIFACAFVQNKVVLDCACGMGYGSNYLKGKASMVIGGDISREAVKYAKNLYKQEGLFFLQLDATKLPFCDNFFDVIISLETIEHLENYKSFLCECIRVLKRGGTFICSTPNRYRLIFPFKKPLGPFHVHEFTVNEVRELMGKFFQIERLFYQPLSFRDRILGLGGVLLSHIPGGSQFKQFVRKTIPHETYTLVDKVEISEKCELDEKQRVRPLKSTFLRFPRTIIIVGKNRKDF